MDAKKLQSTKVTEQTLKNLRLIAALTGEKQYEVLERLTNQEKALLKSKS